MSKYRACKTFDDRTLSEIYWVEKTDSRYGFPAVLIPSGQPKYLSFRDAQDYAKHLNGCADQLTLF